MIQEFKGEYRFLSNFWTAWTKVGQLWYKTNEHCFNAHKTLDWDEHQAITTAPTPTIAKRMGGPKGYKMPDGTLFKIQLREDWKDIRIGIMKIGLDAKWDQHLDLHKALMATHPQKLREGNWWHDNFWGDCTCARCLHIPGQNFLGRLHMAYRMKIIHGIFQNSR